MLLHDGTPVIIFNYFVDFLFLLTQETLLFLETPLSSTNFHHQPFPQRTKRVSFRWLLDSTSHQNRAHECSSLLIVLICREQKSLFFGAESMKPMLYGIRMKNISNLEGKYSCTAFLSILIMPIFWAHLFTIKYAIFFLESWTIQCHESCKHFCLNLERKLI